MERFDVVVIGAGASGLICASEAGRRGRSVVVLDHARKPGNKIRMSGGGRCNFTNYDVSAQNYLSHNPHFCKSALSRFTQWDFIARVERYRIAYHERSHGQLFCDDSSRQILQLLLDECEAAGVAIRLNSEIEQIEQKGPNHFIVTSSRGAFHCESLVVATGGLSIPTAGATPFGYRVAEQFGIRVWPTTAGLVPFTLQPDDKRRFAPLSGIAVECVASNARASFRENLLFTHRGLSGPAILQLSSYWRPGEAIEIDLLPDLDPLALLSEARRDHPQQQLKTVLGTRLPKRLLAALLGEQAEQPLQHLSQEGLEAVAGQLKCWQVKPAGTEGYRTAEVTLGGVDCDAVSSKTMECQAVAGLYFIGEVLDVSGWLGGYNLQWAWSSGWCAGQYV